ncbi:hypothetical protein [Xanthomonas theicola]|uniref:Uncharacterized protein n=1 Tax=Xanthomonas theicola TaxID=56464 RepID=A0A2S6ZH77_9XANT|nr:hypothetical protein [Xanthomonas theicola]PPT91605.1 hypothetical protein XthCFBP4691_07060 [Xanthomonas theicola]QNH24157.1 hypothetical protein G4Q83_04455 [Xanthomonas theicola]
MIRSSKSSNTVKTVLPIVAALASLAPFGALQAQVQPADTNVTTVIVNTLSSAKALKVLGGKANECYPVGNGSVVAGPTLHANKHYTVTGTASANCADGTSLASVNRQFFARPSQHGMYIKIAADGHISIGNQ